VIRGNGYAPDFVAMSDLAWGDFIGNSYVAAKVQAQILSVGGGTQPLSLCSLVLIYAWTPVNLRIASALTSFTSSH